MSPETDRAGDPATAISAVSDIDILTQIIMSSFNSKVANASIGKGYILGMDRLGPDGKVYDVV